MYFTNDIYNNIWKYMEKYRRTYDCRNYRNAAMTVWTRKARFIDGYDYRSDLMNILNLHVNKENDQSIKEYYNSLKEYVMNNDVIGLILLGNEFPYKKSKTIYQEINSNIYLKDNSICYHLLNTYLTEHEIKYLCFKTHNFGIYYKGKDNLFI